MRLSLPPIRLLALPPELLMQILAQARTTDRVILALTCKFLLEFARQCKIQTPDRQAHQASWIVSSVSGHTHCGCKSMEDLLKRFRPKDSHGRPSRSWNLCVDCMRYLPTRKGYWSGSLRWIDTGRWTWEEHKEWENAVKWFGKSVKVQCPSCLVKVWEAEEEP